jgi:hypothetical protein
MIKYLFERYVVYLTWRPKVVTKHIFRAGLGQSDKQIVFFLAYMISMVIIYMNHDSSLEKP